ncbi:PAS domain S-box protein, partial [Patescibacteria group bacterium]|nr:PAS domain S-box protein [Patescibacteria group bacterium]
REKYQQLYGAIRDAILIADTDRQIIELNSAFSDLFGYTLDDLKGKQTSVIYENESEFRRLGELIRQDANKDESRVYTIHYRKKSGEVFSGETAVFMVYNAEGDVSGFMGLIRDITEKESLERQLAYAQKLESIGLLAAGVAHEINTPIMYVSGNMDFLKGAFEGMSQLIEKQKELHIAVGKNQDTTFLLSDIEKTREAVKLDVLLEEIPQTIADIKEGLDRVSLIVQAMKKFSHPGMGTIKPTDVNEAVENIITITSNEWKHTSKLVRDFAKGLPLIECVPGDFNQVILNLLVNAAHANSYMVKENGRGTITVSTALTGEFVEICISDTGTGIPVKNESKIFDPFFTTKEVGKGTGQGLSMVYTIMKNHGGTITFSSEKNTGTSFSLRFPIKQAGQNQSS